MRGIPIISQSFINYFIIFYSIFPSIFYGEIGKENLFKQMAGKMTGYDWLGNYIKENPNASKEQVIKAYTEELNKNQTQKKYGGFMNLKFKKY